MKELKVICDVCKELYHMDHCSITDVVGIINAHDNTAFDFSIPAEADIHVCRMCIVKIYQAVQEYNMDIYKEFN